MKRNTHCTTVVGVFEDRGAAQRAVNELKRLGFSEEEIGVAARDGNDIEGAKELSEHGSHVGTGAATGVAAGAGVGALWGLGIVAGVLPAIGPAIAGGALAAILSSAAAGAAAAGIAGALIGLGIPEEEARYYEDEFKAGRTIVTVKSATRCDEARTILQRCGCYDVHTRPTGSATTHQARVSSSSESAGTKVQVREEELRARKQPAQVGEVSVRKEVHTEHRTLDVPVNKEEVIIERHAASGQPISGRDIKEGE